MALGPPGQFLPARLRQLKRCWWLWLALGLLLGLGWHLEAASRFDRAALDPTPGPLVLDRQGRTLRLGLEAQGRKLIKLPPGELPKRVVTAFVAASMRRPSQPATHGLPMPRATTAACEVLPPRLVRMP